MREKETRKTLVQRMFWEVTNLDRSNTHRVNIVYGTQQFHSIIISDNSSLQIWTRLKACFCGSYSIDEWDDCEYTYMVDTWDRVTLGTDLKGDNEIYHLEDDQTYIYTYYDHILDLIQVGTKK